MTEAKKNMEAVLLDEINTLMVDNGKTVENFVKERKYKEDLLTKQAKDLLELKDSFERDWKTQEEHLKCKNIDEMEALMITKTEEIQKIIRMHNTETSLLEEEKN